METLNKQFSLARHLANATRQTRVIRNTIIEKAISTAFNRIEMKLKLWASSHSENKYKFDFDSDQNNISGWGDISTSERNQVLTRVANIFRDQGIQVAENFEHVSSTGVIDVQASLVFTWPVDEKASDYRN